MYGLWRISSDDGRRRGCNMLQKSVLDAHGALVTNVSFFLRYYWRCKYCIDSLSLTR
jgi:hypothetical protein